MNHPRRLSIAAMLALLAVQTAPLAPLSAQGGERLARSAPVSDLRFAAQLTAPGHEPKFFDDAGCLRDWLKAPREEAPWTAWV